MAKRSKESETTYRKIIKNLAKGLNHSELADSLGLKEDTLEIILDSEEYLNYRDRYINNAEESHDLAFREMLNDHINFHETVFKKVQELVCSESPKMNIEGCKLYYAILYRIRDLILDTRLEELESKIDGL